MPGKLIEIPSYDSLLDNSQQAKYPTDFLNSLNISEMPPQNLHLQIGLPIILLRNINPNAGLCNRTRLKILKVFSRLIQAEISFGNLSSFLIKKMSKLFTAKKLIGTFFGK